MLNILNIAYYTMLRGVRDVKSLGYMLLMPIILILILGSALSSTFEPDTIGAIKVAYLNNDKGLPSRYFDSFLEIDEIKKMLEIQKVTSYDEGVKLIKDSKVRAAAFIMIDEGYSKSLEKGEKAKIHVYSSKYDSLKSSIVRTLIDSFISYASSGEAAYKMGAGINTMVHSQNIKDLTESVTGKAPRAMDYYAVTMLVMVFMYGALFALHGIAEDYTEPIGLRIRSAPIKPYHNFVGKTIGYLLTVFWQGVVLILFTKFAYKANWGDNIATILIICLTFSIFTTALGIMVFILVRNRMAASGLMNTIVPIFTFLAGGYAKFDAGAISYISPNFLAQTAMFNTIYGGPPVQTYSLIGGLWGLILIMFMVSSIAGRRTAL